LPSSATATSPAADTAMPRGLEKAAAVPKPSLKPAAPFPAMVLTTPAGLMRRILLAPTSVTKRWYVESIASAWGPLNAALVPTPSMDAAPPLPTKAATAVPVTDLTVLQNSSATKRTFEIGCTARPEGHVNRGPKAAPFVQPEVVDPANVVTTPAGVTLAMRTSTFIDK